MTQPRFCRPPVRVAGLTSVRPSVYAAARVSAFVHALQTANPPLKPDEPLEEALQAVESPRRIGRPTAVEQRDRTARFLLLAADGVRLDLAAREAGVKPERALRLLSERGIVQTLESLRRAA